MLLKFFVLFCFLNSISHVTCDCDNVISCFGGVIKEFLGISDNNSVTQLSNKTSVIKSVEHKLNDTNKSVAYFELDKDINQTLDQIHEQFAEILTETVKKVADITAESDTLKKEDNRTNIVIKSFDLGENKKKIIIQNKNESSNSVSNVNDIKNNSVVNNLNILIENVPMIVSFVDGGVKIKPESIEAFKNAIENEQNIALNEIRNVEDSETFYDTDLSDDNKTDYLNIDYVDIYKDTEVDPIEYVSTEIADVLSRLSEIEEENKVVDFVAQENSSLNITLDPNGSCHRNVSNIDFSEVIFPWIGTIFVKNGSSNQFDYVCDAAVMTKHSLVTAARCLREMGKTLLPENVIVILGKRSLLSMEGNDVYRIKEVKLHDQFKDNGSLVTNDIAILKTEQAINITPRVETACLYNSSQNSEDIIDSVTTGWQVSADMTPIHFIQKKNNTDCTKRSANVICASYGFDVTTCPSYGGLYFVKLASNRWHLRGILTDDTTKRGICVNRHRQYTDLEKYGDWLKMYL